jgi:hypothetical protein
MYGTVLLYSTKYSPVLLRCNKKPALRRKLSDACAVSLSGLPSALWRRASSDKDIAPPP